MLFCEKKLLDVLSFESSAVALTGLDISHLCVNPTVLLATNVCVSERWRAQTVICHA